MNPDVSSLSRLNYPGRSWRFRVHRQTVESQWAGSGQSGSAHGYFSFKATSRIPLDSACFETIRVEMHKLEKPNMRKWLSCCLAQVFDGTDPGHSIWLTEYCETITCPLKIPWEGHWTLKVEKAWIFPLFITALFYLIERLLLGLTARRPGNCLSLSPLTPTSSVVRSLQVCYKTHTHTHFFSSHETSASIATPLFTPHCPPPPALLLSHHTKLRFYQNYTLKRKCERWSAQTGIFQTIRLILFQLWAGECGRVGLNTERSAEGNAVKWQWHHWSWQQSRMHSDVLFILKLLADSSGINGAL